MPGDLPPGMPEERAGGKSYQELRASDFCRLSCRASLQHLNFNLQSCQMPKIITPAPSAPESLSAQTFPHRWPTHLGDILETSWLNLALASSLLRAAPWETLPFFFDETAGFSTSPSSSNRSFHLHLAGVIDKLSAAMASKPA